MREYVFNHDRDTQSGIIAVSIVFVLLAALFSAIFIASLVSGSIHGNAGCSTLGIHLLTIVFPLAFARFLFRYALSRRYKIIIADTAFMLVYGISKQREYVVRYDEITRILIINEKSVYGNTKNVILYRTGFAKTLLLSNFGNKDKVVFDDLIMDLENRSGRKTHEVNKFGQVFEILVLMLWK